MKLVFVFFAVVVAVCSAASSCDPPKFSEKTKGCWPKKKGWFLIDGTCEQKTIAPPCDGNTHAFWEESKCKEACETQPDDYETDDSNSDADSSDDVDSSSDGDDSDSDSEGGEDDGDDGGDDEDEDGNFLTLYRR